MLRRPWSIVILTIVLLLIPVCNIITTFIISKYDVTFTHYLYSLIKLPTNYFSLFSLIAPAVIMAFAVYSVKKWSYIVLALCALWITTMALLNLYNYYGQLNLLQIIFAIFLPVFFTIILALYFFIPAVKTTYFDPRLRWWETKPRYITSINSKVTLEDEHDAIIINISEGGVLLELNEKISLDEKIKVFFDYEDIQYELDAKVVFQRTDVSAYGVQFIDLNIEKTKMIKSLVKQIKLSGASLSRPLPMWSDDLKKWLLNLLKTGKGFTPRIPDRYKVE
jgi:hypothetical protein